MAYFTDALVAALSVLTIVSDLLARRVRNVWLAMALSLGVVWLLWSWLEGADSALWAALAGLVIGLLVLLPFHLFGWMGAGDVKFFAVLGFLLGGKALLPIWIVASLLGGVHALCVLAARRAGTGVQLSLAKVASTRAWQRVLIARQGRNGLPYAAYMGVGALLTLAMPQLVHW